MTEEKLKQFKDKLEAEKNILVGELASVGRINPDNPKDWQPTPSQMNTTSPDDGEMADTIEDFESNTAILKQLELRFNEVQKALERISDGTYGTCTVCGKEIESDRLEANPAATTCKEHLEEK